MKTVVGLFDSLREAQSATRDLITAGFSRDHIGLLASDATGEWSSRYKNSTLEGAAPMSTLEGAVPTSEEIGSGVGTGTVVGGLGGLLVGLTELAIPGIGWVATIGTLVTTVLGASVGAAAGGLFNTVEKLGVPKDRTGYYAEAVRRGGTLVLVRLAEARAAEAMAIMGQHQGQRTVPDVRQNQISACFVVEREICFGETLFLVEHLVRISQLEFSVPRARVFFSSIFTAGLSSSISFAFLSSRKP